MSDQSQPYVFTTLRYDEHPQVASVSGRGLSCIYLRDHHFARLSEAAKATLANGQTTLTRAGIHDAHTLEQRIQTILSAGTKEHRAADEIRSYRVRLQIDEDGQTKVASASIPRLSVTSLFPRSLDALTDSSAPAWDVVLDTETTRPSNATRFKTHDRTDYDRARQAVGITELAATREVLLYDEHGDILDASITTPYFHRRDQWVTPAASCGGQQGTTRRWALEQGLCTEAVVNIASLDPDERIWLSNAARGFFPAIFRRAQDGT